MAYQPTVPTPAVGKRALYLGADTPKNVSATDEALVVNSARSATFRYPVARLARVVSSCPAVGWSGSALALCLSHGISITWLNTSGTVIGVAHPQHRSHVSAPTALQLMLEDSDGLLHYQHWQRSRRMHIYQHWLQLQTQSASDPLPTHSVQDIKCAWVYASEYNAHLPAALRGLCLAYVAAQLANHHLPPVLWLTAEDRIDLDEDFCELLWAEMNLCSGNLATMAKPGQTVTALFESWSARNASALLLHIHSLQRRALQALHE